MPADSCTAIGGRVALHQPHVVGSDRDQRDAESRLEKWHSSVTWLAFGMGGESLCQIQLTSVSLSCLKGSVSRV